MGDGGGRRLRFWKRWRMSPNSAGGRVAQARSASRKDMTILPSGGLWPGGRSRTTVRCATVRDRHRGSGRLTGIPVDIVESPSPRSSSPHCGCAAPPPDREAAAVRPGGRGQCPAWKAWRRHPPAARGCRPRPTGRAGGGPVPRRCAGRIADAPCRDSDRELAAMRPASRRHVGRTRAAAGVGRVAASCTTRCAGGADRAVGSTAGDGGSRHRAWFRVAWAAIVAGAGPQGGAGAERSGWRNDRARLAALAGG